MFNPIQEFQDLERAKYLATMNPSAVLSRAETVAKYLKEIIAEREEKEVIEKVIQDRRAKGIPFDEANTAPPPRNKRRDDFWPLIEKARREVSDPFDTAAIWLKLCEWARKKIFPLTGITGNSIQWRIDTMDNEKELTRKMLSDRLGKQKRSQNTKGPTALKRVK